MLHGLAFAFSGLAGRRYTRGRFGLSRWPCPGGGSIGTLDGTQPTSNELAEIGAIGGGGGD